MSAALIAAGVVAFFAIDLGRFESVLPLRQLAEREAAKYLERPMHIGRLYAHITPGEFALEDVVIEGLSPTDRPFLTADRISVKIHWSRLFGREAVVEVRMTGWAMLVEKWDDRHSLPKLTPDNPPGGERSFTTTVNFVYAQDGQFTFEDHGAPWSVVARNLDVAVVRNFALQEYDGIAHFSGGTVAISDFLPMRADMRTRFLIDGSKVRLHQIDLVTDGARSDVSGVVDFANWPAQRYDVASVVDFPRMREIFFADEDWELLGTGRFDGYFELFKGGGRDLSGEFTSDVAGVNGFVFPSLRGSLSWLPESFTVHRAESDFYGGRMNLTYGLAPLGTPRGSTATFLAGYENVDLQAFGGQFDWGPLDPRGRLSGRASMRWPNGRFGSEMTGEGETVIAAPDGVVLATARLPDRPAARRGAPASEPASAADEPFDGFAPLGPQPVGGRVAYAFTSDSMVFSESWAATPTTYMAFSGSADDDAGLAFRATSHDWQASDRLLAAVMTARGSRTRAVEVGGRGTFDGRMTGGFDAPRVSGRFTSQALEAWDVVWGRATGDLVIQGGYVQIQDGHVDNGAGGTIDTTGRFALGFRDDDIEEIDARFAVRGWPMVDLRHAFGLDDWPVDGTFTEVVIDLRGAYTGPVGSGTMRIEPGVAWGERFDSASGDLEFEGTGLQIRRIAMAKGPGLLRGAAIIGWDNTYSFDVDGERIPVESLDTLRLERAPLSGVMRFTATGAGSFDNPTYTFSPDIPDLFAGDEFIGHVSSRLIVRDEVLTVDDFKASSIRLTLEGSGRVALNEASDAVLRLDFFETSLDPYLKFFAPELSPYARAIASGAVRVNGPLARAEAVTIDATLEQATLELLDFALGNDGPLRLSFARNRFQFGPPEVDCLQLPLPDGCRAFRLQGQDTRLELTGGVDRGAERVDIGIGGAASLTILQLFFPEVRASGAADLSARLQGPLGAFSLNGTARLTDGRLRHSAFSHSLTAINGPIVFDRTGVNVDNLRARLGDGAVQFGGAILLGGMRVEDFNVRARGTAMNLRYPQGLRSTVNADLALTGSPEAMRLTGNVDVLRASYSAPLDPDAGLLAFAAAPAGGAVAIEPPAAPTGFPLTFDVHILATDLPEPIIDNRTAQIRASADLQFSGTVDRPLLSGSVILQQGSELSFSGNRYFIQRGTVDFLNGPAGIQPYFDVEAETRVRVPGQTYVVTFRVTGTEDAFVPTLTSDPPLSSDLDILALLLGEQPDLGRVEQRALQSPQQAQAQLLRTAAAQLMTAPISSGIERVVEQAVPIDTVSITPLLGNEAALDRLTPTARITLGKRISSRVFLTYSRALNARSYDLILLEYDQNDRLSWVVSRNEDRTFALDFRIRYVF
jgi:hypothetical protein